MPSKSNTQDFIRKSVKIHGDKYDYTLTKYTCAHEKVSIICPVHGEFSQVATSHLRGKGCWKCGVEERARLLSKSGEDFVTDAKEVHGGKYDYSLVNYTNNAIPVSIICIEHGVFLQKPSTHLTGCGCHHCGINSSNSKRRRTFDEYVEVASIHHGQKFNYAKALGDKNILVYCPDHGWSEQTREYHLRVCGCRKCSKVQKSDTESFIQKAIEIHGDRYDYSCTSYVNARTKIDIRCRDHDSVFTMTPNKHLSGRGCPVCNNRNRHSHLFLYLLESENMVKIGISYDVIGRVKNINRSSPEQFNILSSYVLPSKRAKRLEKFMLNLLYYKQYLQPDEVFDGSTECFLKSSLQLFKAVCMFNGLCSAEREYR